MEMGSEPSIDTNFDDGHSSARWPHRWASNILGAIYHVLSRGDRRETIFYDNAGKQREIISRRAFSSRRQLRFHMTYSFLQNFWAGVFP
jgi:hypothetical protein